MKKSSAVSANLPNCLAMSLGLVVLGLSAPQTVNAAGCLNASPVSLERKSVRFAGSINLAAKKHKVDRELIQAVIAVESCFQPKAVSSAGAQGLMQLMPATADRFGVSNSFDTRQNIMAGSRYLKWLLTRYSGNIRFALAGYNAGEGRVDQYKGIPPFRETQRYVKHVIAIYTRLAPGKVYARSNTIANGTVYFPYKPLKKKSENMPVVLPRKVEAPKALTAKPGRQGLDYMKSQAPHLYRKP